jgi:hypothetical protein
MINKRDQINSLVVNPEAALKIVADKVGDEVGDEVQYRKRNPLSERCLDA